jgi:hypothetical protein
MDLQAIGRIILIIGVALVIIGGVLMLLGRTTLFSSFGGLPGDIRIQGENFSCLFPIVSMILLSLVLTIVLNIIIRLINRP